MISTEGYQRIRLGNIRRVSNPVNVGTDADGYAILNCQIEVMYPWEPDYVSVPYTAIYNDITPYSDDIYALCTIMLESGVATVAIPE